MVVGTVSFFVYIFEKNEISGNWKQRAMFGPDDGESDYFGSSVGVSGNIVVVGADLRCGIFGGSTYISSGNWELNAILHPNDGGIVGGNFRLSVAVYGNVLVVGAVLDDDKSVDNGSAYIFERNTRSGNWEQKAMVVVDDGNSSFCLMKCWGFRV